MQPTSSKKEIWTMGTYSLLTLSIMVGFMYLNTFATEVLKNPRKHPGNRSADCQELRLCRQPVLWHHR